MKRTTNYKLSAATKRIVTPVFLLIFGVYSAFAQEQLQLEKQEIRYGTFEYDSLKSTIGIELNFEIPAIYCDADTALVSIRTQILSAIYETPVDSVIRDSSALVHLFFEIDSLPTESEMPLPYQKTRTGKVLFANANYVSYAINGYDYSGGAHGYTSVYYYEFDVKTGKRLTESDIFKGDYEKTLTQIFLKKLETEDCFKELYIDRVRPNGNFFINEKGITYFFNSYEIASYACGNFELFIPFEELSAIVQTK
ncbi:MAG: DUF3298 and DUF4163 domain-containing protein [Bacteroidales bacterium]|jgi:hypothetical protein|nr:DUF3298 and DUF4163 domain-containing protein [Bacteroidales bacterium]